MSALKRFITNENLLVFLFCLAVILGPALTVFLNNELQAGCTDCTTYLGMGHFDFHQTPIRKYRPLVPLAAGCLNTVLGPVFRMMNPSYFERDFSLAACFLITNTVIMGFYGLLIYKLCKAYGCKPAIALFGTLVMLSCRWTSYWAALPMVDAWYCLVIAMAILAMKTNNEKMLAVSLVLGPLAKESYVFFIPVIFFFAHVPKSRMLIYLLVSAVFALSYRYFLDGALVSANSGFVLGHELKMLSHYASGLLSPNGLYKLFSVTGLWILMPVIAAMLIPGYLKQMSNKLDVFLLLFLLPVLAHMIFGSYERHFYIAMPLICVMIAVSAQLLFDRFASEKNKFI